MEELDPISKLKNKVGDIASALGFDVATIDIQTEVKYTRETWVEKELQIEQCTSNGYHVSRTELFSETIPGTELYIDVQKWERSRFRVNGELLPHTNVPGQGDGWRQVEL